MFVCLAWRNPCPGADRMEGQEQTSIYKNLRFSVKCHHAELIEGDSLCTCVIQTPVGPSQFPLVFFFHFFFKVYLNERERKRERRSMRL